ncbi:tubulin-folding cofactor A-like [Salvia splendens]|uniref:tubulin-folding cofactor A-like n=1 Tax=Salvia splendens TaxID=180675 RepID=UPI001C256025|nr:tubulin-folding cofactor A-like [Salvia splendens]
MLKKSLLMKAKGADPYVLKQQENVLSESRMMVPDCRRRLEAALSDLKATLVIFHALSADINNLSADEISSWRSYICYSVTMLISRILGLGYWSV